MDKRFMSPFVSVIWFELLNYEHLMIFAHVELKVMILSTDLQFSRLIDWSIKYQKIVNSVLPSFSVSKVKIFRVKQTISRFQRLRSFFPETSL